MFSLNMKDYSMSFLSLVAPMILLSAPFPL